MSYRADWGNTPAYKAHVAIHGNGDSFTNDEGYPKEPVNSIMWALIGIGMSSITESNISEAYARLKFYEKTFRGGTWGRRYIGTDDQYSLAVNWEDYTLTPEHVQQVLHLSTNCTTKSRTAWIKDVVSLIQRDTYMEEAREMFFGHTLTPNKIINLEVNGWKKYYEERISVNA